LACRSVLEKIAGELRDGRDVLSGILESNGLDDDCIGVDTVSIGVFVECLGGYVHGAAMRASGCSDLELWILSLGDRMKSGFLSSGLIERRAREIEELDQSRGTVPFDGSLAAPRGSRHTLSTRGGLCPARVSASLLLES
jgi:hypothetical protein